jgi:hypothetical protein
MAPPSVSRQASRQHLSQLLIYHSPLMIGKTTTSKSTNNGNHTGAVTISNASFIVYTILKWTIAYARKQVKA